jgi:cysteinyl-tRNA synthetase
MALQLFDSLTREKRAFEPLEPPRVRMYNCGPTVYQRAHIGNLRSFLMADSLRRWLELSGYEVRQVMNITDVGHVLDDADEGEDKLEAQARKERKDPWEISRHFTRLFFQDLEALGFRKAAVNPRASEHIPEMLELVEGLLAKGYAYQTDGSVYFEVARFPRYGRLSGNTVAELEAGARVEVREEKRHPADFALWKSDPKHLMKWPSRFGPDGFPGWHIECSAMARKHLGDELDIHTGGEDNVFPHHECEIAQSEAFTGKPFARFWMHAKFLQVDGGKMSKRLGNTWSLDDVRARGFTPRELRYALIRGHYRGPLNFTWGILEEARSALEKLDDLTQRLREARAGQGAAADPRQGAAAVTAARQRFDAGMDDDLNVPQALAALFELRSAVLGAGLGAEAAREAWALLEHARTALGVLELEERKDEQLSVLLAEYAAARARRDWSTSDRLRAEIRGLGYAVQDTPTGPRATSTGRERGPGG